MGVAQHFQAHTVGVHVADFFFQIRHEQAHEAADFFLWAFPVLGAEGKEAQLRNAHFCAGLDNVTHSLCARGMAQSGGHEALFGPATVAIHDDGNVLRQGVGGWMGQRSVLIGNVFDFSGIAPRVCEPHQAVQKEPRVWRLKKLSSCALFPCRGAQTRDSDDAS